jgi:hypothetical protein
MKEIKYDNYNKWMNKINELTNGNYYAHLWHSFLNYYNKETDERVGYEIVQPGGGYYIIDNGTE